MQLFNFEVSHLDKKFYVYFKRTTWHFIGWKGYKAEVSPDYTIRRILSIFHETSCGELLPILKLNGVLVAKEWLDMPLKDIGVFDCSNNECYLYICDETPDGYTKWFAGETRCSPANMLFQSE